MRDRRNLLMSGGLAFIGFPLQQTGNEIGSSTRDQHNRWVGEALTRMLSIKPGMTRKALLAVFTQEGGLSTALERVYVSQDCAYFKVRVRFRAVGRDAHDNTGRETSIEDERDVIVSVSEPFLQFSICD